MGRPDSRAASWAMGLRSTGACEWTAAALRTHPRRGEGRSKRRRPPRPPASAPRRRGRPGQHHQPAPGPRRHRGPVCWARAPGAVRRRPRLRDARSAPSNPVRNPSGPASRPRPSANPAWAPGATRSSTAGWTSTRPLAAVRPRDCGTQPSAAYRPVTQPRRREPRPPQVGDGKTGSDLGRGRVVNQATNQSLGRALDAGQDQPAQAGRGGIAVHVHPGDGDGLRAHPRWGGADLPPSDIAVVDKSSGQGLELRARLRRRKPHPDRRSERGCRRGRFPTRWGGPRRSSPLR